MWYIYIGAALFQLEEFLLNPIFICYKCLLNPLSNPLSVSVCGIGAALFQLEEGKLLAAKDAADLFTHVGVMYHNNRHNYTPYTE
jgi:hypothetical protein